MLSADAMGTYNQTREGASVSYQCNDGFRPSPMMSAICARTAQWVPPITLCTLVTG